MVMPVGSRPKRGRPATASGFTLIELLIVMAIIGIIITFILIAAMDGVHRAEERATQALISKLETGLDDRLGALLEERPVSNNAHFYMAQVYNGSAFIPSLQRANVIAQFDQIKAEVPDVFYYNSANTQYPFNFAAQPFPGTAMSGLTATAAAHAAYFLPLGNSIENNPAANSFGASNVSNPYGTGIYGATYTAAAGIYKNLGYAPSGYDGADNNSNGLIDEYAEGVAGLTTAQVTLIQTRLANHKHKTARSEMLYALLVEGQGPLGSVFSADDFSDREVTDTDKDGLPEFVDGWGEPIQFYRWPIYYHSDLQRGVPVNDSVATPSRTVGSGTMHYPYVSVFDPREQDSLDPSQQLLAPSWWSRSYNTGAYSGGSYAFPTIPTTLNAAPLSPGAAAFSMFFFPPIEPMANPAAPYSGTAQSGTGYFWDRGSNYYQRRAFFTKSLIVSSGLDRELGIARLDSFNLALNPTNLLIESHARQTGLGHTNDAYLSPTDADPNVPATGNPLGEAGQDDISNHNISAPGGVVQ